MPDDCRAPDCAKPKHARGCCSTHYARLCKYGSLDLPVKTGPPTSWVTHFGYRHVHLPKNPMANSAGAVYEHRLVMSQMIGRPLTSMENVHHINGNRLDNRPENLELWSKSQPAGQRVTDKVAWAVQLLETYRPGLLARESVGRETNLP